MWDGRRTLIFAICCMSLFVVALDNTIVNIALPAIRKDLHASTSGLQWTIDAYTIVLASLLMLGGSTADRLGRRRVFQLGLLLFTLGSLLCGLAPSLAWLVAFRVLQAVGGSMLNPVALSIISNTFPDPRERARALGFWGATFGLSMALGPVLGGLLVPLDWRAIFWINVPVGIAAIVLAQKYIPESRAPRTRRVDPVGQILVIVSLASLTYAIIEGPGTGWTSTRIVALFAVAAAATANRATMRVDVQPVPGPSMIAYVSDARLTITRIWPTGSTRRVRGARDSGMYFCANTMAAMPTGTLIQKIARQSSGTSRPPSTGPSAMLRPNVAPQKPRARARSRGSGKVLLMIDRATGLSIEPPTACSTRKAMSHPSPGASPHSSEPRVKSTNPIWKTRRRPRRSAVEPPSISRLASTIE